MIPTPDLSMPLFETVVRATVILLGAVIAALLLRRSPASARHALWTTATLGLLLLPVLHGVLPTIAIPGLPAEHQPAAVLSTPVLIEPVSEATTADLGTVPAIAATTITVSKLDAPAVSRGELVTLAWLLGVGLLLLPLALAHRRARRLVRGAVSCHDGRLLLRFSVSAELVGVRRRVQLLLSPAVRTPMTGGLLRPVVLLPMDAASWSDEWLETVLRHELVHVRRCDALRQLASRIATALYWFHPLAWHAGRSGALAREQACDEAVLSLGTRPSRYARHLLELADPVATPRAMPALVRLDHPHLEERVMAILRASPAPASRRHAVIATLGIAAWTLCVAAVGPATAQIPRAPTPPAAPAPPTARIAAAPAEAPLPPPVAPAPRAAPAAPMAPPPPIPGAYDCEAVGSGYRTGGGDRDVPVRMHTTNIDGLRICAAVRGKVEESAGFLPTGRLPVGVTVTLASSGPDGEQRLEIAGTSGGNSHTWTVNGQERTFDAAAAEWRDAMIALVQARVEKSRAHRTAARRDAELARAEAQVARQAISEARRVEARDRAAVAARVNEQARVAARAQREVEEARAAAEVRDQERAEVARVRSRAVTERAARADVRQAEAEARRQDMERNMVERRRVAERGVAGVRAAEERRLVADDVRRARESEQRAARALEEGRVAEVDAELAPLTERLKRAIEQIGPQ